MRAIICIEIWTMTFQVLKSFSAAPGGDSLGDLFGGEPRGVRCTVVHGPPFAATLLKYPPDPGHGRGARAG